MRILKCCRTSVTFTVLRNHKKKYINNNVQQIKIIVEEFSYQMLKEKRLMHYRVARGALRQNAKNTHGTLQSISVIAAEKPIIGNFLFLPANCTTTNQRRRIILGAQNTINFINGHLSGRPYKVSRYNLTRTSTLVTGFLLLNANICLSVGLASTRGGDGSTKI